MAISKKFKLDNGIELNYNVVSSVELMDKTSIKVDICGFKNKTIYELATKKQKYIEEQSNLIDEFKSLDSKVDLTEEEQSRLTILQQKINELANEINNCKDFYDYVLGNTSIILPYSEDLSIDFIESKLLELDSFKSAKIVN